MRKKSSWFRLFFILLCLSLVSGPLLAGKKKTPRYGPPKPLEMELPAGAKIGFTQAMLQGDQWFTPRSVPLLDRPDDLAVTDSH